MGETGSGAWARHSWSAGAFGITTSVMTPTGARTTAPGATNEVRVVADSFASDPAQQVSACTWVTCRIDCDPWDSDRCIGHEAPSWQHAIRASGVACQPAQTATLPAQSPRTERSAARRRITPATEQACWTAGEVSNRVCKSERIRDTSGDSSGDAASCVLVPNAPACGPGAAGAAA